MSHNENPFAYGDSERGSARGFQDYENPFAFQTETAAAAPGSKGLDTTYVTYSSNPLRLQRWNSALRLLTFLLSLGAILLIFFSRENPSSSNLEVKYNYVGTNVFLLYTNFVVCVYALVLTVFACVMGRNGNGQTTPSRLVWPILILNVCALLFVALAFATALSIEQLNHQGFILGNTDSYYANWPRLCDTYGSFCGTIDAGLGFSMASFCSLLASTCIDAYCIHARYR